MFQLGQILTSTQFIRRYRRVLRELEKFPQPVLITQRNGQHMVFVNAEVFEDLTLKKMEADGLSVQQAYLKDIIQS